MPSQEDRRPHRLVVRQPQTGDWEVIGNIFVDCPVSEYESTTTVHIPYDYGMALNDAERAKELVLMYAGAGSPSLEQ